MKCELVNNYIEALTQEDAKQGIKPDIKKHTSTCPECEALLQHQLAYLNRMSAIVTPELSEQRSKALLNKVTQQQPAKNDSSFLQGFVAASVLAVSIFGAWNLYNNSPDVAPIQITSTEQPDYYVTEVVLVINAPEDMYDADLNIVLPQHVALEGYDNTQELTWPVDLKAGANTLSLPIKVNRHQASKQPLSIMAKLYHYAEEREFEIPVDLKTLQGESNTSANIHATNAKPNIA